MITTCFASPVSDFVANPVGETRNGVLRLDFDHRVMLQFRGSAVTSDASLLAYRELDDALGLSDLAGATLAAARTGRNGRHALVGLLRQSVFGRLAGYEDVNDAERLRHDPAIRWIVGGKAAHGRAASPSQMGRFDTHWLAAPGNDKTNTTGTIKIDGPSRFVAPATRARKKGAYDSRVALLVKWVSYPKSVYHQICISPLDTARLGRRNAGCLWRMTQLDSRGDYT